MAKIVMEQLQFDRIPQSAPGAGKDPINKLAPPLTEQGLDALTHSADQLPTIRHIGPCDQQQVRLIGQPLSDLWTTIAQITQPDAAVDRPRQPQSRISIIPVGRRQQRIADPAGVLSQQVQFKAKEPAH